MTIIRLLFLLLSIILIAFPWLPSPIAGNFILISLTAIPIFLVDLLLLFTAKRKRRRHHRHRAWYQRQSPWRFVFAIVSLAMIPVFRPYFPITRQTTTTDKTLTVVSWNVENYQLSPTILKESSAMIRSKKPDIICLQERPHDNLMAWDSIRAAFPEHIYTMRNTREDEVLNLAVLSRYPIDNVREYYYPQSYNKSLRMDLHIGENKMRLFNVHLETTGLGKGANDTTQPLPLRMIHHATQRDQQANELLEASRRSPYPVVLCGDFNDTRTSYAYRRLTSFFHDLSRLAPLAGSYQRYGNIMRIDYILYSDSLAPVSYELLGNPWSDHKIQVGTVHF